MYDSLKFSIATADNEDRDVWLVVMDSSVPPRFEPTVVKANARLGIWSVYDYVPASTEMPGAAIGWHVARLSQVLGNPRFTIEGVGLHVTGPEDAPRIQVRFNNGDEIEEVRLIGPGRREYYELDTEKTTVGPQICPVAVAAGSGGGARDGGMPSGAGGGHSHVHTPLLTPREELAEKPKPEPLQFVPELHTRDDVPSVRITAEDGDRRVEIVIENPGGPGYAAQLASEHIVAIVQALGGAK